jgi:hypothetical protein
MARNTHCSDGGAHEVPDDLLLRSDLNKLFDGGYLTVDPAVGSDGNGMTSRQGRPEEFRLTQIART